MSTNVFLLATRKQLRFPSVVGLLTTEDLWTIPLRQEGLSKNKPSVEAVGNALLAEQAQAGTGSIFGSGVKSEAQERLELQLSVIREIIAVRQEEARVAERKAALKSEAERLTSLIKSKTEQNASVEDLKAQLAALQAQF